MNPRRLFTASCIALITSAFSFMIRQNISDPLRADFSLTQEQVGTVMGAAFLGMAAFMLVFAPLCDILGMGKVLLLAWLCHLAGILGTIFAAEVAGQGFVQSTVGGAVGVLPEFLQVFPATSTAAWVLWISTLLVGAGNGLVEIAINPLAATLFPTEKTHYLNVLHAWWPGGLILSGLLASFAIAPDLVGPTVYGFKIWQVKMGLLLLPLLVYGLLCLGQRFPQTERVAANVSTGTMFLQVLRPMFLLWACCMMLTASTELGPNQWQESVLTRTARVSGTAVFVYTSGLMFCMRFFAGPLAHKLSPVGMLTGSALLSGAGLYALSHASGAVTAFAAATVFGVGVAYFWPTMLGVTAERFPKGGALLLGLMGCVGNLAIWQVLPQMGAIYDSYSVEALVQESPALQSKTVRNDKGEEVPLVTNEPIKSWVPETVRAHVYPAGTKKLNPQAVNLVNARAEPPEGKGPPDPDAVQTQQYIRKAEVFGAAWAFRWVAVLPCVLVVVFGLIALVDKLRGGYKAVHIGEAPGPKSVPVPDQADWAGSASPEAIKGAGRVEK
jgi:MFS family permease